MHQSTLWQLPGLSEDSGLGLTLHQGWESSCAFRVNVLLMKYFKAHLRGCQLAGGPVPIILNSKYFVFPHQRREAGERGEEDEEFL